MASAGATCSHPASERVENGDSCTVCTLCGLVLEWCAIDASDDRRWDADEGKWKDGARFESAGTGRNLLRATTHVSPQTGGSRKLNVLMQNINRRDEYELRVFDSGMDILRAGKIAMDLSETVLQQAADLWCKLCLAKRSLRQAETKEEAEALWMQLNPRAKKRLNSRHHGYERREVPAVLWYTIVSNGLGWDLLHVCDVLGADPRAVNKYVRHMADGLGLSPINPLKECLCHAQATLRRLDALDMVSGGALEDCVQAFARWTLTMKSGQKLPFVSHHVFAAVLAHVVFDILRERPSPVTGAVETNVPVATPSRTAKGRRRKKLRLKIGVHENDVSSGRGPLQQKKKLIHGLRALVNRKTLKSMKEQSQEQRYQALCINAPVSVVACERC